MTKTEASTPISNTYDGDALRALDDAHHWHPFTDTKDLVDGGGSRIIVRGEGAAVWDSEGNRYIDGMAGLWCVNVGYGRKELADAAYQQLLELPYYNNFFKTATPSSVELAARISDLLPDRFNHVFFTNSGSESTDTVARLVRTFWEVEGKPERQVIISRKNGYHGSTMAAASMGGMDAMHKQGGLPLDGFEQIMQPYWYGEGGDEDPAEFGKKAAQALEDKIEELGADKVAAFIGEPVQGAGGVIIPPETYWPEINRICKMHDILLVADEVICGFGRTGNWFGFQTLGIEPDIIPMAKGLSSGYLPIGAVAIADKVARPMIDKGGEFTHGFTYSGHPVACAVALANLDVIEKENLVERVADDIGPYFAKALATLADHPLVGETRSIGLLGAVELVADKKTRERFDDDKNAGLVCREHCFESGVIMRSCGQTMVLSPPLSITREEVDEIIRLARVALDRTAKDLKD